MSDIPSAVQALLPLREAKQIVKSYWPRAYCLERANGYVICTDRHTKKLIGKGPTSAAAWKDAAEFYEGVRNVST